MANSTMALWDLRISMFWMDAEMEGCEERANSVLVMEPLMEVVMEEWLALAPTVIGMDDCTEGTDWILIEEEEAVPPVATTPRFPSWVATTNVYFIARGASSISVWERFFDASCSMLLTHNAGYQSLYSVGIKEEQMAISPNLIFNTCQIVRDWCLRENVLPHHLHNQDTFPFWVLVLSLMKGQWKMLVNGSNWVSSSPPQSINKSSKLESAVSAETVVSCNDVQSSLVIAVPTGGRWGALIWKRLLWMSRSMFCCSLMLRQPMLWDATAQCLEELWTLAEKHLNLCVERIWGVQESTLAEWIV